MVRIRCFRGHYSLPRIAHFLNWRVNRAASQQQRDGNAANQARNDCVLTHMSYSFTMKAKIYHNPRCSKSRATLALLEERGIPVEVVEYLKQPPSAGTIRQLLTQLGLKARDVVRSGEPAFRESGLSADSPADALIALIEKEPIVLQRPIVVYGNSARIGRPPEQVMELFA